MEFLHLISLIELVSVRCSVTFRTKVGQAKGYLDKLRQCGKRPGLYLKPDRRHLPAPVLQFLGLTRIQNVSSASHQTNFFADMD